MGLVLTERLLLGLVTAGGVGFPSATTGGV
jgi:hypothetical protein